MTMTREALIKEIYDDLKLTANASGGSHARGNNMLDKDTVLNLINEIAQAVDGQRKTYVPTMKVSEDALDVARGRRPK